MTDGHTPDPRVQAEVAQSADDDLLLYEPSDGTGPWYSAYWVAALRKRHAEEMAAKDAELRYQTDRANGLEVEAAELSRRPTTWSYEQVCAANDKKRVALSLKDTALRLKDERLHDARVVIEERNAALEKRDAEIAAKGAEITRLTRLLPPEHERGQGIVGEGSWSAFAGKMMEERDYARDQLAAERKRHAEEVAAKDAELTLVREDREDTNRRFDKLLGDLMAVLFDGDRGYDYPDQVCRMVRDEIVSLREQLTALRPLAEIGRLRVEAAKLNLQSLWAEEDDMLDRTQELVDAYIAASASETGGKDGE